MQSRKATRRQRTKSRSEAFRSSPYPEWGYDEQSGGMGDVIESPRAIPGIGRSLYHDGPLNLAGAKLLWRARLRPMPGIARGLAYQVTPSQISALEPKITVRSEPHP